ncbi:MULTISPECIES: hypothetical protein [unclassified Sphingobium]|jgi:hypothetical protein|uniref:hypothetical protein n=1 Tax=unclassified Sphingobium TaxID=2611147 RepID=UPI00146CCC54|nr:MULTISPECIES: hypothetical protein [unclassified Sphingobium]NML91142.1 hypothetical protein [Sphingobium sp. TB-6]WDA36964.1 hypothetical protein PO876_01745 [Sphingobium sp. YC-XJ3]
MHNWMESPTITSIRPKLVQELSAGFGELDCQTASVETRRQLYAALVQEAILIARTRFPENEYLDQVLMHPVNA